MKISDGFMHHETIAEKQETSEATCRLRDGDKIRRT